MKVECEGGVVVVVVVVVGMKWLSDVDGGADGGRLVMLISDGVMVMRMIVYSMVVMVIG